MDTGQKIKKRLLAILTLAAVLISFMLGFLFGGGVTETAVDYSEAIDIDSISDKMQDSGLKGA